MNYIKHYERLINRARERNILPGVYFEKHHIVPKCLGGSNDDENIVKLFPEEHYVAHQLLVKIHPDEPKIVLAARMMTISSSDVRRNNKEYKWLRERFIQSKIGIPRSKETKLKLRENAKRAGRRPPNRKDSVMASGTKLKIKDANIGKILSQETKEKIRIANIDYWLSHKRVAWNKGQKGLQVAWNKGMNLGPRSEEVKEKISKNHKGMTGKNHTAETKEKISLSKSLLPKYVCPHCLKESTSGVMKRWHFDNCKLITHSWK